MSKHTAGSWFADIHGNITNDFGIRVAVADNAVNNAGIDGTEAYYNAKLIAASPEMLDLLLLWKHYMSKDSSLDIYEACESFTAKVERLLEKAEGTQ